MNITILWEWLHCVHDVTLLPAFQSQISCYTFSVIIYNRPTALLVEKCATCYCIDTITLWNVNHDGCSCQMDEQIGMTEHRTVFFPLHSNNMTSWTSSLVKKVLYNVVPFFLSPQCSDTTTCIRHATFLNIKGKLI